MKIKGYLTFTILVLFTLLSFIVPPISKATNGLEYQWGYFMGGSGIDLGVVFVDPDGYIYLTGSYSNTVDFDPTSTTENYTSAGGYDMYLSKYQPDGTYLWTKVWGGTGSNDTVYQVLWDSDKNMYLYGEFQSTVDFNPDSASADSLTSSGSTDPFVTKYNSNGTYAWTKKWGGTGADRATFATIDSSGNFYFSGAYRNTVDFDPDAVLTTNKTSNGNYDAFVSKFDSNMNFIRVKTFGGSSLDYGESVRTDSNGNLYLTGEFKSTVNFNPDGSGDERTSLGQYDCYLIKHDSSGNYIWSKNWGSTGDDMCLGLTKDSSENFYISGYAGGLVSTSLTIDLDPGSNSDTKTLAGSGDSMIVKLNSNGNYVWGKTFGSSSYDFAQNLRLDSNGYLYVIGSFSTTVDFDPGSNVNNLTSNGSDDIYLSKFDTDGNFFTTKITGSTAYDFPNWEPLVISGNTMFTSLSAGGNLVLNPDGGTATTTFAGNYDTTFVKFNIDSTPPADFTTISPKDYETNATPTLSFNKSTDTNSISSYTANLDLGKSKSYSISGIPASGNGTSYYLWRDDANYKIEYLNEGDSDSTNDIIKVYFKDITQSPLTAGLHNWKAIAYDSQANTKTMSIDFKIDWTSPQLTNFTIANVGTIKPGGVYTLSNLNKGPSFMGKISDPYIGSSKTNPDGTVDNFDKVSSGVESVKLTIQKQLRANKYDTYLSKVFPLINGVDIKGSEKYENFYITTPFPLKNGKYRVSLEFTDKVGNSYTFPYFYLKVLSPKTPNSFERNTLSATTLNTGNTAAQSEEEVKKTEPPINLFADWLKKFILQIQNVWLKIR